ncbi:NADPH-dependent FMN reductase [Actinomadura rudentiformis]|uniref:NAD(P)H-dependent oxidoreductase n=1 Tax=Actinomadura rudentiformis TaxID=359158 RepID=A0A6H9YZX1_9ACTN|nr:NAD(P)H-dependent oxidoreductase [Actinomadura rudentiformis]KAB2348419.1 NAD(P)H-dependent oxidoreductase [Actinomadura rudentiformis]
MSETRPLRTAIIIGSTREGRFALTVADWFAGLAARRAELELDVIDLAETRLPDTLGEIDGTEPAAVRALAPRLAAADAFVVVTPEYNHSFPAPLKTAIDWYVDEWRAKPVGFVSYGGTSGGLRAVEQLRQVFAELQAVTIRETVSFHSVWNRFDEGGQPIDAAGAAAAADGLLDQLTWWARALRTARTELLQAA